VKHALIVRGGRPAHQPFETTEHFRPFLESSGFHIRVEDSSAIYADFDAMSQFDLIIQCIESPIDEASVSGLRTAVHNGCGFVGWHGGVLVGFTEAEAYYQMIGGKFVAHPGKLLAERTGADTDYFIPHTIEITELGKSHEITKGISDFELTTEQYWLLTDPYMQVLATTTQAVRVGDSWNSPVTSPAIWTRQWGKGKIFICSPGHNFAVISHPTVTQVIQNGITWAVRF
jgi:type 1 glutamine amidotransferase